MKESVIGYKIKLLREKAKLSQAKLATALGDVFEEVFFEYGKAIVEPPFSNIDDIMKEY